MVDQLSELYHSPHDFQQLPIFTGWHLPTTKHPPPGTQGRHSPLSRWLVSPCVGRLPRPHLAPEIGGNRGKTVETQAETIDLPME